MCPTFPAYAGGEPIDFEDPDSVLATATDRMNLEGDTIVVANDELGFQTNSSTATGQVNPECDTIFVADDELSFQTNFSTETGQVNLEGDTIFVANDELVCSNSLSTTTCEVPGSEEYVQQRPGAARRTGRSQLGRGALARVASGRVSRQSTTKRQGNAQFACPYYILDPEYHFGCRPAALRNPADIRNHIKRKHKAPEVFCPRCWEIFDSAEQFSVHSLTPCDEKPFPYHWARPQDLEVIERNKIGGNGSANAWTEIFRALFPGHLGRLPTFHNAPHQDIANCLSSFRNSPYFQEMMYNFGTNPLSKVWPIIVESIFAFLKRGQSSGPSAQVLDATNAAASHVVSTASMQETMIPYDGQADFQGAASQSLSGVNENSETFHSSQGPYRSHIQGWTQYEYADFEVPASQTTQLQAIQGASASTQSPSLNAIGQVSPLDHEAHTALRTSNDGCISPQCSFTSIVESFGQDVSMQGSTHTFPLQMPAPLQTSIAGQGQQAEPSSFSSDSDPAPFDEYMDDDGYNDPFMGHMLIDSDPAQLDTHMGDDDDLSSSWNRIPIDSDPAHFDEYMEDDSYVDPFMEHMLIDSDPAQLDTHMGEYGDLSSSGDLESHQM